MVWRWYQIAAHQPFFRAHAHLDSKRREPWVFEEPWTGRMRNAIRMRYRLLPLWNLLFYKASVNGEPPMRPIWYNYPTVRFGTLRVVRTQSIFEIIVGKSRNRHITTLDFK